MAFSLAQNAIALLIDLAERGEIDPWDVQVIEVIDRFLSSLTPVYQDGSNHNSNHQEAGRTRYEADLSQSGQAFLYASMLVLFKADSLARLESNEEELSPLDEAALDTDGLVEAALPLNLERRLRRRAVAQPPQNRRVTLKELIAQLELMATAMAEQQPRARVRRPRPQSRTQAVRAIAQLAHQENLSEVAAALEQFLSSHWQDINQGEEWLEFEMLLELWSDMKPNQVAQPAQANKPTKSTKPVAPEPDPHSEQGDRVGVFWALLFLSAQSKVELAQEEFYKDLKVRHLATLSEAELSELSALALSD